MSVPFAERMARTVTVLLFAQAREAVGHSRLSLPVPSRSWSVQDLLAQLTDTYPKLGAILPRSRLALNGTFLNGRTPTLSPGDELAIHPPYSGG
jgi:molybdopterin converting factor small subunit